MDLVRIFASFCPTPSACTNQKMKEGRKEARKEGRKGGREGGREGRRKEDHYWVQIHLLINPFVLRVVFIACHKCIFGTVYVPIDMSPSEGLLQSPCALALIMQLINQKEHSTGAFSLALASYPGLSLRTLRLWTVYTAQTPFIT